MDILRASADPKSYPLWMLFSVERLKEAGDFRAALPSYLDKEGRKYALLFSTKDLAQRFAEANPVHREELMPIENSARLCHLLRLYRKAGVASVGANLSLQEILKGVRRKELQSIAALLQALEKSGL
jgi:hypothetical protein